MTKELNTTERAFDLLSSIPWLKGVMKSMFVMGALLGILPFLVGEWTSRGEMLQKGASYVGGILFFSWIFRLWNRRDRERDEKNKQMSD